MELFINKMRRLKGVRKMIIIEEAWKAIAKEGMADLHPLSFQDCPQILRRGSCGDAGSR